MAVVGADEFDAGDLIWVDFGPPAGHEQAGRRPALVLSPQAYNAQSSVLIVCPITRTRRDWPFTVALPALDSVTGYVLVDQIKVIDPKIRAFEKRGRVPEQVLREVRGTLAALLGIPVSN